MTIVYIVDSVMGSFWDICIALVVDGCCSFRGLLTLQDKSCAVLNADVMYLDELRAHLGITVTLSVDSESRFNTQGFLS